MNWLPISLLLCIAQASLAVEYDYREITADTAPTRYCYPIKQAIALTSDHYNLDQYGKRFCSALGEGWHVDKRKADGAPECVACTGDDLGKHRCYTKQLVVSCQHFKAGSLTFPAKRPQQ